jgi:3-deoxy-7-phosphoheptulonate synthase
MIVILKSNAEEQKVKNLVEEFEAQNLKIHYSQGTSSTILGLVGDTAHVDTEKVLAHEVVEDVRRIS